MLGSDAFLTECGERAMGEISSNSGLPVAAVARRVRHLDGRPPFMLARDVAELYGVQTKEVMLAIKRNPERFPEDFAFKPTPQEIRELARSLAETSTRKTVTQQLLRNRPICLTRGGTNMLATIFMTPLAVARSIQIMRGYAWMEEQAKRSGEADLEERERIVYEREAVLEIVTTPTEKRLYELEYRVAEIGNSVREIKSMVDESWAEQLRYDQHAAERLVAIEASIRGGVWNHQEHAAPAPKKKRKRGCTIERNAVLRAACEAVLAREPKVRAPDLMAAVAQVEPEPPVLRCFQRWLSKRRRVTLH